ncbi:hypothetical protein KZO25_16800 [Halomonas sp. ANAO-440]|uniref:hypothetical protein n=1 Tax=Halomonas sp. ANAO-440 TaxID=2861360 RepID=UPI001CAA7CEF|nr:hypothetical protein [Halomonas sp. ANAO-440]MBZ0331979.1 hypothetical protein [Halomonas sp. ANAO-440]
MKDLYHDSVFYLRTNSWEGGMRDVDAYERIKARSQAGEPLFIILHSWYLTLGKGCEKNVALALSLINKEEVQESSAALCAAGLGVLRGYYGRLSEGEAISLFDKAEIVCARKGGYMKGVFYFNKFLSCRNDVESFKLAGECFKKASMKGHATSLKMYLFCSSQCRWLRFVKYCSVFFMYMVGRRGVDGPERWWCYRDLKQYRPTTVEFAENCGHALGYFSKGDRS